jgi:hypothetical protein
VWGGWLSKKPFQKVFAMHRLTFDPGQRRVLLLVLNIMHVFVVKLNVMVSHIVLLCCIIRLVGMMRSGS